MLRFPIAILPFLLGMGSSLAAGFPLEDYVPADFHRHYLSATPDLNWSRTSNRQEFADLSQNDEREYGDSESRLTLNHGSRRFSQDLAWNLANNLGFSATAYDNGNGNGSRRLVPAGPNVAHAGTSHSDWFKLQASSGFSAKWFPKGRLFLSPSAEGRVSQTPDDRGDSRFWNLDAPASEGDSIPYNFRRSISATNELSASMDILLAIGYGRIQDVTFAETGLFMLDRLSESLGREIRLDKESMHDLEAYLEARRKLRPFYDMRMASIYDMESVAAFLKAKTGGDLSARAILEMADEWNHAGRHRRESGWEARIHPLLRGKWTESHFRSTTHWYRRNISPDARLDRDSLEEAVTASPPYLTTWDNSGGFQGETAIGAGFRAIYKRPWRRFFQFDLSAYSRLTKVDVEYGSNSRYADLGGPLNPAPGNYITYAYPFWEAGWEADASAYPNSRTAIRATLQGSGDHKSDYLGSKKGLSAAFGRTPVQKTWSYAQSLVLNAEYFVSPRLSVLASASGSLDWHLSEDELNYAPSGGSPPGKFSEAWYSRFSGDLQLIYYFF